MERDRDRARGESEESEENQRETSRDRNKYRNRTRQSEIECSRLSCVRGLPVQDRGQREIGEDNEECSRVNRAAVGAGRL